MRYFLKVTRVSSPLPRASIAHSSSFLALPSSPSTCDTRTLHRICDSIAWSYTNFWGPPRTPCYCPKIAGTGSLTQQTISVLTEARIDEPDQLAKIEHYISAINAFIYRNDILAHLQTSVVGDEPRPFPQEHKEHKQQPALLLVLELRASGKCGYYFVDHDHQCLFWLDPFDFSHLVDQVRIQHTSGLVGESRLGHHF
jgi:hypothetical protein